MVRTVVLKQKMVRCMDMGEETIMIGIKNG